MATVTKPLVTAAEFLAMDLGPGLHELVRGEIVAMTPPDVRHGRICSRIARILDTFGEEAAHGWTATNDSRVAIDELTVRGGDILYYREDRWPGKDMERVPCPGPPDLVVEVISAHDRPGKVQGKVADYLNAGVPMVWVAHPKRRTLTIYRGDDPTPAVLKADDPLQDLPELPGFVCRVGDFFA